MWYLKSNGKKIIIHLSHFYTRFSSNAPILFVWVCEFVKWSLHYKKKNNIPILYFRLNWNKGTPESKFFYLLMLSMYRSQIYIFSSQDILFFFTNSCLSTFIDRCGMRKNVHIQLQSLFYILREVLLFFIIEKFGYEFIYLWWSNIEFRITN